MRQDVVSKLEGSSTTKLWQKTDDKNLVVHSSLLLLSGQFEGNIYLQFANIVYPLTHLPVSVLLNAITCQVLIRVTITKYKSAQHFLDNQHAIWYESHHTITGA